MLPKALPLEADASAASTSSMQGQARSLAGRKLMNGNARGLKVGLFGTNRRQ